MKKQAQIRGQTFTGTLVLGTEPMSHAVSRQCHRTRPRKILQGAGLLPIRSTSAPPGPAWPILPGLVPVWASCTSGGSGLIRCDTIRGRKELNPL